MIRDREAVFQQESVSAHLVAKLVESSTCLKATLTNQMATQRGQNLGDCLMVALYP